MHVRARKVPIKVSANKANAAKSNAAKGTPAKGPVKPNQGSAAQINTAVARLPRQSNASIGQVLINARRLGIEPLAEACEAELRTRGALVLTQAEAERTADIGAGQEGKALAEVIEIAFRDVPPRPDELQILTWIWQHPGTSYSDIGTVYKNKDLSLVIGHLVYHRFGYFRPLLGGPVQSDLLLERDKTSGKMCYTLRPEAVEAFRALGLFSDAA
jgi:hypothetical protein